MNKDTPFVGLLAFPQAMLPEPLPEIPEGWVRRAPNKWTQGSIEYMAAKAIFQVPLETIEKYEDSVAELVKQTRPELYEMMFFISAQEHQGSLHGVLYTGTSVDSETGEEQPCLEVAELCEAQTAWAKDVLDPFTEVTPGLNEIMSWAAVMDAYQEGTDVILHISQMIVGVPEEDATKDINTFIKYAATLDHKARYTWLI